jgi:hypothetical protein
MHVTVPADGRNKFVQYRVNTSFHLITDKDAIVNDVWPTVFAGKQARNNWGGGGGGGRVKKIDRKIVYFTFGTFYA